MVGRRQFAIIATLAALLPAAMAPVADAVPVTVGQPSIAASYPCNSTLTSLTYFQASVRTGGSYSIPSSGLITSWSFHFGLNSTVPGLILKVVEPTANPQEFKVVGESPAGTEEINKIVTYPVSIPVRAGDLIGYYAGGSSTPNECIVQSGYNEDVVRAYLGNPALSSTHPFPPEAQTLLPVSATVQPQPTVTSLAPSTGPPAGGTQVTITGEDFTGATAVNFGNAQVGFHLDSDTQITASSPAGPIGSVDVRVTTAAGQSSVTTADQFSYANPPPETKPTRTGKRAAALRKCRKKHGKAKRKCIKRAKKLPV